jgi:pSer/pThr/pTyr-binding forkhead associated (FHA) protein
MPKAKLIINGGESEVSIDEGVTSIGRVADNTISLAGDSNVSRYHVEIETRGKDFWLIELGSSNGTTVNGGRVYDEKLLKDGDVIVLGGSSEILFEQEKETPIQEKSADSNAAGGDVSAAASNVPAPSVLPTAAPESEIAADTAKASKLPLMLAVTGIVCGLAIVFVFAAVAITWSSSSSSKCEAKATITSPENGDTIIKETEIELDAQNTDCVKRAIFLLDDEEFDSADEPPFKASLDPKKFPELADGGIHSLKIVFEDTQGNKIVQPGNVMLAFETASTPTPTPVPTETPEETPTPKKKDDQKPASPSDTLEMCKVLLRDVAPGINYKFDPQFAQEVQKKTSEYISEGFFARATGYRDVINVAFQETGVGAPLGYISAMSRSQFKLPNQGNEQGIWRMNNDLVTAKG